MRHDMDGREDLIAYLGSHFPLRFWIYPNFPENPLASNSLDEGIEVSVKLP